MTFARYICIINPELSLLAELYQVITPPARLQELLKKDNTSDFQ